MPEEPAKKRLGAGDRLGKYEVVDYIASGGMGAVYKARDTILDRIVALKILPRSVAKRPQMLDRFRREARAAARLQHSNIVAIYEFGDDSGLFYLALEYVPGTDLQRYIERRQKLPPEEAREIITQATRALAHAHAQGIVHRDVKPSNFLLTRKDGRVLVKLTDLGLAIQPSDDEFRLTREGTTVGTVDYMAPEQARDSGSADIRSDLYSLGCTFYHLLAGTAPFAQGTMAERLLQHLQAEPPDVRNLNRDVPPGYVAILKRMLAKDPADRYQTPEELLHDLEDPDSVIGLRADAPLGLPRREPPRDPAVPEARKAPDRPRDRDVLIAPAAPVEPVAPAGPAPPRPVKPVRTRDQGSSGEVGAAKRKPTPRTREERPPGQALPPWIFLAGGAAFLVLIGIVVLILVAFEGTAARKEEPAPPPGPTLPPVAVGVTDPEKKSGPPPPKVAGNAGQMGPGAPVLPALAKPLLPPDAAALRREFYGPSETFPRPPAGAPVLRVSRAAAPGPTSFRSLAAALAALPDGPAVIEVHDQGPLPLGNLPALAGRDVFLRGGPGFRPLLAWEPPRPAVKEKSAAAMLALSRGQLVLEGLDVALKWTDPQADAPACLFQVAAGGLYARDCTFSFAGRHPQGVFLTRLQGDAGSPDTDPCRLRLTQCYARGTDLVALGVQNTSADVLVEQSVLVDYQLPLLQVVGRDEDEVKLRVVRSTLVAGQNLLRIRDADGKGSSPQVRVMLWDTILARDDPAGPEGDLVRLDGKTDPDHLRWRAVNSVYAGWKKLLAADGLAIDGNDDLAAWHARFPSQGGDRFVPETWPNNPPAQLEALPPAVFVPAGSPVAFAASLDDAAVGAVVGRLPPEPVLWLQRTFDRHALVALPPPDPGLPTIDDDGDGLYHGERVKLPPGGDLGLTLAARLAAKTPAPRVVFHVSGSGECPSSPLKVKGIAELVLYFEPPKDGKAEPLTVTVQPKGVGENAALFEVERGSLELVNVRVRLDNSTFAVVPPHVIKVHGGSLVVNRCQLLGPLGKSPGAFKSLVALAGPSRAPLGCRLTESVLLSGKGVVQASGAPVNLYARQSVFLSLEDALQLDLTALADATPTTCLIENNTWALRQALLSVRSGPEVPDRPDLVVVQAVANYFTDPFGANPVASCLLRAPEPVLARGLLLWQGKGNAFDRRLDSFLSVSGQAPSAKQSLADWLNVWGRTGESDPLTVEPGSSAKAVVSVDAPQLDRLALPREVRPEPGHPLPGADLVRLGLQKKK
jgi:serine/threonine-protein kinase